MTIGIYIAAHERNDAVDVYKDKLTNDQIDEILEYDIDWLLTYSETGFILSPASKDGIENDRNSPR